MTPRSHGSLPRLLPAFVLALWLASPTAAQTPVLTREAEAGPSPVGTAETAATPGPTAVLTPSADATPAPSSPSPAASPEPKEASPTVSAASDPGFDARPWLKDLYQWKEERPWGALDPAQSGAYGIGNGRAFALLGITAPIWTWTNLYGNTYQEPSLGSLKMVLRQKGEDLSFDRQCIGWVRRSGAVEVEATGGPLQVTTVDFAPAGSPNGEGGNAAPGLGWDNPAALVRIVRVRNTSGEPQSGLEVAFKLVEAWNVKSRNQNSRTVYRFTQEAKRVKPRTFWALGTLDGKGRPSDRGVVARLGTLAPGAEAVVSVALASEESDVDLDRAWIALEDAGSWKLLDRTRDFWAHWHGQGVGFSGDPKTCDLFEIESQIFKVQEAASGGFSPLIGYSYTWIRDNNGPIRWFLKTGHWAEAKAAIDFFHDVASSMGALPNSIRVDYRIQRRVGDLAGISVEHAETPNWIILQHWWQYLSVGDLAPIRDRWAYLKRCLTGQVQRDRKFMFHRDETYLWCLMSRIFDSIGTPNDFLTTYGWAVDSSFDYVAAADRMAFLAKRMGRTQEADRIQGWSDGARRAAEDGFWDEAHGFWAPAQSFLGPRYPQPYANILLNPFWCGYSRTDLDPLGPNPESSAKAVRALAAGYKYLGRSDGFWKTTPEVDFFVGMNPGQLLVDLLQARSPWADKAYQAVWKSATPSGEFAEMYDGRYRPWNPPAWGVGTSGRIRPWEGGLNTESIFDYLLGFQPFAAGGRAALSPHLPEGQDFLQAEGLPVGDSRLDARVERRGPKGYAVKLTLTSGSRLRVDLDLWGTRRLIQGVQAPGDAKWVRRPEEEGGRRALVTLDLQPGGPPQEVTWTEDGSLPGSDLKPPAPTQWDAPAMPVTDADVALFTSPSAVLAALKPLAPPQFPDGAWTEVKAMQRLGFQVSFLDVDLPIRAADVAAALLDPQGKPRSRLAVFGRGAFTPGKHDFKSESFWNDPVIGRSVQSYLEAGGALVIGAEIGAKGRVPDWMGKLTGGWDTLDAGGKVTAAGLEGGGLDVKPTDELDVANPGSEKEHGVEVTKPLWSDRQALVEEPAGKTPQSDDGRGFAGDYRFGMKTEPGERHQLRVRVNAGRNLKGLTLSVKHGGQWLQLGTRTQNLPGPAKWLTFWFDVPAAACAGTRTEFRISAKDAPEVNLYHLWMVRVQARVAQPLAGRLGYPARQGLGEVDRSLRPLGKGWSMPLVMVQAPETGALILRAVGKGLLVKTELPLDTCRNLFLTLLSQEKADALRKALEDESAR